MKPLTCKCCGATGLKVKNGYFLCEYCDNKFLITGEDFSIQNNNGNVVAQPSLKMPRGSSISLGNDVEMLLHKCRTDRRNARKYANLILDIDPTNKEALKYL